jgi:hypothetical protein
MSRLNFRPAASDNQGVDQVSRPMQIALVAVVLLAGMWFTVLKPKPDTGVAGTPAAAKPEPVAPGVKGLVTAVDKAKAVSAKSDATNAKIEAASGGDAAATSSPASAAKPATKPAPAKHTAVAKAKAVTPAAAKPGAKAATAQGAVVDPSERLLASLTKGKVLVVLFEGKGADDKAARKAVHQTALHDAKHVVSAYVPIADVGKYVAITSDVQVLTSPTVLVIGADHKAIPLTGYVDAAVIRQAVGDARRDAGAKQ